MADITHLPKDEQKAILARRKYFREWNRRNPEKTRKYRENYWKKKAAGNTEK